MSTSHSAKAFCQIRMAGTGAGRKRVRSIRHLQYAANVFVFILVACMTTQAKDDPKADASEVVQPPEPPEKYILDYPVMDNCCPPIRSTFYDATSNFSVVRGHRFKYQPNGGYGLPIVDKVDGKNLIHVGADLGWFQLGEPVFAIGAGVVRISQGPPAPDKKKSGKSSPSRRTGPAPMPWGNVVMIEQRRSSGDFFTTIYGHLDTNRKVAVGDIVKAGQHIGNIGRNNPRINGGYNPHLHLGIREGRMIKPGMVLFHMTYHGDPYEVKIAALHEDVIELTLPADRPQKIDFHFNGEVFRVEDHDGKPCLPARIMWRLSDRDFPLTGYALATDGWRDPIAFLREHHADTRPAPFTP